MSAGPARTRPTRPRRARPWSGRERPAPRPLIPARLRGVAVALLVACVAVVAVLGMRFAGHTRPGRLDAAIDAAFRSGLAPYHGVLEFLARFGDLPLVTAMTAALVLGCAAARRWRGAVLAAVAVPVADGLAEGVLKPAIGRTLRGWLSYPSGHATSSFALATISVILLAAPSWPRVPAVARRLLMLGAILLAVAVPSAMVGLGLHYFTDIVGGAALGVGTALLTALLLDTACGSDCVHPGVSRSGVSRSRRRSPIWPRCCGRPGPSASGPRRSPRPRGARS